MNVAESSVITVNRTSITPIFGASSIHYPREKDVISGGETDADQDERGLGASDDVFK